MVVVLCGWLCAAEPALSLPARRQAVGHHADVGRPAYWQRDGHAARPPHGRTARRRRRRQPHQLSGSVDSTHPSFFRGVSLPPKKLHPSNGCQIVCCKSFFSAGTMNDEYITETFFRRTINRNFFRPLSNRNAPKYVWGTRWGAYALRRPYSRNGGLLIRGRREWERDGTC